MPRWTMGGGWFGSAFAKFADSTNAAADFVQLLVGEFLIVTHGESLSGAGECARASWAVRYEQKRLLAVACPEWPHERSKKSTARVRGA